MALRRLLRRAHHRGRLANLARASLLDRPLCHSDSPASGPITRRMPQSRWRRSCSGYLPQTGSDQGLVKFLGSRSFCSVRAPDLWRHGLPDAREDHDRRSWCWCWATCRSSPDARLLARSIRDVATGFSAVRHRTLAGRSHSAGTAHFSPSVVPAGSRRDHAEPGRKTASAHRRPVRHRRAEAGSRYNLRASRARCRPRSRPSVTTCWTRPAAYARPRAFFRSRPDRPCDARGGGRGDRPITSGSRLLTVHDHGRTQPRYSELSQVPEPFASQFRNLSRSRGRAYVGWSATWGRPVGFPVWTGRWSWRSSASPGPGGLQHALLERRAATRGGEWGPGSGRSPGDWRPDDRPLAHRLRLSSDTSRTWAGGDAGSGTSAAIRRSGFLPRFWAWPYPA